MGYICSAERMHAKQQALSVRLEQESFVWPFFQEILCDCVFGVEISAVFRG